MSISVNTNALSKGWKRYQIMHKNKRVASVREDGTCTIYYPSFLPYNLYLEKADETDIDARVSNLTNFYYWCASRVLTLDRKYAKEILSSIHAPQAVTDKERAVIALSYHCLSLTDVYWVRTDGEKTDFDSISLYNHSLSGAFVDVSLTGRQLTVQNAELVTMKEAAGDVGTQGVAPKAWIRKDGVFYLLKDGDERDVKAELLASRVMGCFAVNHVSYTTDYFDGKLVSKSKIITSPDYSIVSMEYIDIYCANHGYDREKFIRSKSDYDFCMMNIMDYLTGNTDRHWGNWGFMIDNRTNKLLGLYPLMDFNKAFLAYDTLDGAICQTLDGRVSQKEAAVAAVRHIGLNQTAEIMPEWFEDAEIREMFFERLSVLTRVCHEKMRMEVPANSDLWG